MRRSWKLALTAAFFTCFSAAPIHSFDFGPRPLFAIMEFDQGHSIYLMYSYQYLLFNALAGGEQEVEGRSVETTGLSEHLQSYQNLNISTDLFFGLDTAVGYMTNRFNERQEDSIPYDEVTAEIRHPVDDEANLMTGQSAYWYARYRRVSQDVTTNYRVSSGPLSLTTETLNYRTRLDIAKLGGLTTQSIATSGMDVGRVYAGLTYVRLDTALPDFTDDGEFGKLPLSSDSLGLAFAGSVSLLPPFSQPRVLSPYLTFGYAATFFGISRMNESWATGVSFGPTVGAGEGVFDGSFELGMGMFISDTARIDANLYFNGVVIRKSAYEQMLGQGGVALSVELGI